MHHPPSRPHRASRRLPPQSVIAFAPESEMPEPAPSPARIEASSRLLQWLQKRRVCLALSTGAGGKIITLGAGATGLTVFDVRCDSPGALLQTEGGLYVTARSRLWRFDDVLTDGELYRGTGRLCLPSQCRPTGAIGILDLATEDSGKLLVAASAFNCVARMNSRGDLKPIWRPAFIDGIVAEDRCHLNGFCLRDGALAYVTVAAASNEKDGWRRCDSGGQVIEALTQRTVAEGMNRPCAPRLYRDRLWLLESGSGTLGWIDIEARRFVPFVQVPDTPRGLRFVGDHALVTTSGPAGIHWINVKTGKRDHDLRLEDWSAEAIDVAVIPGETVPRLAGLSFADSGLEAPKRLAL